MKYLFALCLTIILFFNGCSDKPLNNPHAHSINSNTYFASFDEQPKTLDPAKSYSADEAIFTAQIYEPPLQYDYLLEPYTIIPLTATQLPQIEYLDKNKKLLPKNASNKLIAFSVYTIHIKPNIFYQPHPAFAKDANGSYLYRNLSPDFARHIKTLEDFPQTGTRELTAADYVYQIKRLADPKIQSPIYGLMSEHILGMKDFFHTMQKLREKNPHEFIDLRNINLSGVKLIDRYTYQIILNGEYPQFIYWLTMPFFAPIPWEADQFYAEPLLTKNNINFDWYPVGTGAYMLTENNPNQRMVMEKNPNFHPEYFPTKGTSADQENGLLKRAGQRLPFIDTFVFQLEKESIPRWSKFLQGYYDQSGISSDNFDQVIQIDAQGNPFLTPDMQAKKIKLYTNPVPAIFYIGFNWMDNVVGGDSERARKLRQAIAIAVDYEEYIQLFLNGRGIVAQSPIPPGIFGYEEEFNPYLYQKQNGKIIKKSLADAKQLLKEAGYDHGIDPKTKKPLILTLDIPASANPDLNDQLDWYRHQFAKLGISLDIQATQYNRFQEKMRKGNSQMFLWGWQADYPDPENFLFLLYSKNGKVKYGGENASNYSNAAYDALFEQMRYMPNNEKRKAIIDDMQEILQYDTPWLWGFYPKEFALSHAWLAPSKPRTMINNTLKYAQLDPANRAENVAKWNKPIFWPLILLVLLLILSFIPVAIQYYRALYRVKSPENLH